MVGRGEGALAHRGARGGADLGVRLSPCGEVAQLHGEVAQLRGREATLEEQLRAAEADGEALRAARREEPSGAAQPGWPPMKRRVRRWQAPTRRERR